MLITEPAVTPRIVQGTTLADANAGLVGLKVFRFEEVNIVGGHHWKAKHPGQFNTQVQAVLVTRSTSALELQVVAVRVQIHPVTGPLPSQFRLAGHQRLAHITQLCAGERDQAVRSGLQPLSLDNRLAEPLALGVTQGNDFSEVEITIVVSGKQRQPERVFGFIRIFEPEIRAYDGLDTRPHGRLIETHQRAHIGLLGQADGRHAQLGNTFDQRFHPDQAIHHGVLGMDTEVYKSLRHNVRLFLL